MDAPTHPLFSAADIERESLAYPRLTAEEMAAGLACGTAETYPAGWSLYETGQRPVDCFIVVRGAVEIIDTSIEPQRMIATLGAGHIIGSIEIFAGRPAVAGVRTSEPTEVIRLTAAEVRRLLVQSGTLGEKWITAFMRRHLLIESLGFEGLRVYGAASDLATLRVRQFLHRNGVLHHWWDPSDPSAPALPATGGERRFPVVAWAGDVWLENPSLAEIARRVGVQREIPEGLFDTVIVGSGPAGLAAAVYAASEGLRTLVIDPVGPGGQAGTSSRIENYAGFPAGISGRDLALRAYVQALKFGAIFAVPVAVRRLHSRGEDRHEIVTDDGVTVQTRSVILATGVTYRDLAVEGLADFRGAGVYHSATQVEALLCTDRPVHVIGAGNSAGQAAMFLSKVSPEVNLVVRGGNLRKSMSAYLSERVAANPRIRVRLHTELRAVEGAERLEAVRLENTATGESTREESGGIFILIGAVPSTDFLGSAIALDANGFVLAGAQVSASGDWALERAPLPLETSSPGIFVAGDCRSHKVKRVAAAVGDGALAATCVTELLGTHA
jgi:thioredoxin reductase (NADPH)